MTNFLPQKLGRPKINKQSSPGLGCWFLKIKINTIKCKARTKNVSQNKWKNIWIILFRSILNSRVWLIKCRVSKSHSVRVKTKWRRRKMHKRLYCRRLKTRRRLTLTANSLGSPSTTLSGSFAWSSYESEYVRRYNSCIRSLINNVMQRTCTCNISDLVQSCMAGLHYEIQAN